MAKTKLFTYIIDDLNAENGEIIKKALQKIPEIKSITIDTIQGTVALLSTKDYEIEVKYACEIAGASFRIKMKTKKGFF